MPTWTGSIGADLIDFNIIPGSGGPWLAQGIGGDDTILADTMSPETPDTLEGGGGHDSIVGNRRDNVLYGDDQGGAAPSGPAGKDTIFGGDEPVASGTGGDFIDGGGNNDMLYGEGGNDTVLGGSGNDRISGGDDFDVLSGDLGHDRLKGDDGNDTLRGGGGDDLLEGGRGDDSISGDDDDDTLVGGRGNDSLFGGIGTDAFRFEKPNQGFDTVFDFNQSGIDRIQIVGANFGLTSTAGPGFSNASEFGNFGNNFAAADASTAKIVVVNNVVLFNSDGATAVGSGMIALAMFLTGLPANAGDYEIL